MGYTNGISSPQFRAARNSEIYERALLGETQASLAREFKVTAPRISIIARHEEHRRRIHGLPWGERLLKAWARAAYLEDLEPIE